MDDFRLRVFITAAKTLNFTKCAEQLFISQPAVSKHIGELESRYKVQLFERSGSRLALTEAGRVMLEHAERIADGYRRLQYEMDLFTDRLGGELKVGASTTIAQYVLPQVLARFTARFPEVKVSLAANSASSTSRAVRSGGSFRSAGPKDAAMPWPHVSWSSPAIRPDPSRRFCEILRVVFGCGIAAGSVRVLENAVVCHRKPLVVYSWLVAVS